MKAIKYIFLLLLLIVVASSIYVATLENTYHVQRTKVINAPEDVVLNMDQQMTAYNICQSGMGISFIGIRNGNRSGLASRYGKRVHPVRTKI